MVFLSQEEKHGWNEGIERNSLIRLVFELRKGFHFQMSFLEAIRSHFSKSGVTIQTP